MLAKLGEMSHSHDEDGSIIFRVPPSELDE